MPTSRSRRLPRTLGVSGRATREALIASERDPLLLADLARGRLKNKIDQLTEALDGRFNDHHAYATQMHLDHSIRSTNGSSASATASIPP
ncbi:hypothetical protein FCN77_05795 [Arthrobacter sp. 24S4-2]|uniref:hypothetical protein n=1 Tax=Arthrobacter sp. 24S4-2 TaxID=2575374 RepID=UPI0010C7C773|nr:hypothetical protein [Arthrobacter sp. 24S4-2]QCO97318.1 hypothetical protein FCN77_05795 [Arthrobacter sp. 24S4-2]